MIGLSLLDLPRVESILRTWAVAALLVLAFVLIVLYLVTRSRP